MPTKRLYLRLWWTLYSIQAGLAPSTKCSASIYELDFSIQSGMKACSTTDIKELAKLPLGLTTFLVGRRQPTEWMIGCMKPQRIRISSTKRCLSVYVT